MAQQGSGISVREIEIGETHLAGAALVELRGHLGSVDQVVDRVDTSQRAEGYRLVGAFIDRDEQAAGAAGFRIGHSLAWGRYLYVDDLIVRADRRGRGCGRVLLEWLEGEARRQRCDQLHLDSGVRPARRAAHRLYLDVGLAINSLHFDKPIEATATSD
jgi:GNAT superfamily N-acetyltransferase